MKSFQKSAVLFYSPRTPVRFYFYILVALNPASASKSGCRCIFFSGVCLFVCVHEGWWVCWMIHQPRANSQYLEQHKRRESRPDWWTTKEKVLEHVSWGDVKRVINLLWNWSWGFTDPSVALKHACTAIEFRRQNFGPCLNLGFLIPNSPVMVKRKSSPCVWRAELGGFISFLYFTT